MSIKATYDVHRSYDENYADGPTVPDLPSKREVKAEQSFLGFPVNSLLGVPAGPLLNGNWVIAYAKLGFDLLVYKTVRTEERPCHPQPNCMFLSQRRQLLEVDFDRQLYADMEAPEDPKETSITNSFGMPSRAPDVWQADFEKAKAEIGPGQLIIASVVGTPGDAGLKADYVKAAALAVEAGAPVLEINLSCPNVVSREGSIYADATVSSDISKAVKAEIGDVPLIIKIGYFKDPFLRAKVIHANAPYVDAISSINTLSFTVIDEEGEQALPGEGRARSGVCGSVIRGCALSQAEAILTLRKEMKYDFAVVGVGGVMTPEHVSQYLDLGCDGVMSATGAMWDPLLAHRYWQKNAELSSEK